MSESTRPPETPGRVLAIGAHPDDCEIGCGGTLARLAQAGWDVTMLVCTNGNKGSHDQSLSPHVLAATREAEQHTAAALLGAQRVVFLRYNDGELDATSALRLEMALYIRHFRPHLLFTHDPWRPYMLHPDHRAVGFSVVDGVVSARDHLYVAGLSQIGFPLWRPETLLLWFAEQPDHTEDISTTLETKIAALEAHQSQLAQVPGWMDRVRQRAQEAGAVAGVAAGEQFRHISL